MHTAEIGGKIPKEVGNGDDEVENIIDCLKQMFHMYSLLAMPEIVCACIKTSFLLLYEE